MWLGQFQRFKAFSEAGMGKAPVQAVGRGMGCVHHHGGEVMCVHQSRFSINPVFPQC